MSPQQRPYDPFDEEEDSFDERGDERRGNGAVSGYEPTESVDLARFDPAADPDLPPLGSSQTQAARPRSKRAPATGRGAPSRAGTNRPGTPSQGAVRTGPRSTKTPAKPHDPNIGRELGSYRVISLIGSGGMGQVYEAEHVKIGRRVALKLLRPEYAAKRDAVHRFFGEARAVNAIGHENIVDITDYVETDSGETFFIMELLQGQDLSELLRNAVDPIPLHRAMRIALQVCEALHAAHVKQIIHRDLKPDNVFIVNDKNREDFVKLLDFGVAKLQGTLSSTESYQTAAGSVIGTPAYMSPEQASGIPVDQRTDVYSLGAILYEMFTGHPVFNAKSFGEFVVKHMNDQPIPPRDLADAPKIPMALEAVILRCLEKDPAERYQSVTELRDDLARATATVETSLPKRAQYVAASSPRERSRARRLLPALIGVGVLTLAIVAFLVAAGIPIFGDGHQVSEKTNSMASNPGATEPSTISDLTTTPTAAASTHQRIDVTIRTTPAGARVSKSGSTDSLGKTPLTLDGAKLGPTGGRIALKLRLDGYREKSLQIRIEEDAEYHTDLAPIANSLSDAVEPLHRQKRHRQRRKRAAARKSIARNKAAKRRVTKARTAKRKATPSPKAPTTTKRKIDKAAQVDPFAP